MLKFNAISIKSYLTKWDTACRIIKKYLNYVQNMLGGGGVLEKSNCPKLIMSKLALWGRGVRKFWTMSKILQSFTFEGPPKKSLSYISFHILLTASIAKFDDVAGWTSIPKSSTSGLTEKSFIAILVKFETQNNKIHIYYSLIKPSSSASWESVLHICRLLDVQHDG